MVNNMQKRFVNILNNSILKYLKKKEIPLGRWRNNKTNNEIKRSIDYANMDHCGPCGSIKLLDNKKL